jgi:hypothetical protein
MKDCVIISRSEDGTDYIRLGRKAVRLELFGDWQTKPVGRSKQLITYEYSKANATRLEYHEAIRICRKLQKDQKRSRYSMPRYYAVRKAN